MKVGRPYNNIMIHYIILTTVTVFKFQVIIIVG